MGKVSLWVVSLFLLLIFFCFSFVSLFSSFFSFYCFILSSCKWEKFWHFKVALNIFYFAFRLARNSFVFWVSGALVTQDELTLPSYRASLSSWMHPFWGLDWRFRLYCSIPITFCVITRESLNPFGCFLCFGIPVEGRFFNFLVDWVGHGGFGKGRGSLRLAGFGVWFRDWVGVKNDGKC